ncbi:hypothetical protein [Halocola ammonii]
MNKVKPFLIIFGLFLFCNSVFSQSDGQACVILSAAELTINGETNVNSYSCALRKTQINDTLELTTDSENSFNTFEGLEIVFLVKDFACGMDMMTEDFRELLKVEEHPRIVVTIDRIELPQDGGKNYSGPVKARIRLHLANAERQQVIENASIHQIRQKTIFTGSYETLITSYNLVPPSRMFGAIQAEDTIEVQFAIQMKKS